MPSSWRLCTHASRMATSYSDLMALRSLGYGHHRSYLSPVKQRSLLHLRRYGLFLQVVKAFAFSEMKTSSVLQFLQTNIICRFGIPKRFVHDKGPQFRDHRFYRFCDKYKIQSCPSTPYNPAANGLAEAFNKTLCKILKKMISSHKRDWSDKLPEALWTYRTTV